MFSDPQFWVAVAFVAFIELVFNPIRKILTTNLLGTTAGSLWTLIRRQQQSLAAGGSGLMPGQPLVRPLHLPHGSQ